MAICILYAVHYIYIHLVELDEDCFYWVFFFCGCLDSFSFFFFFFFEYYRNLRMGNLQSEQKMYKMLKVGYCIE